MIKAKKINDAEIKPVVLPEQPKNILGSHLFCCLSANIFICAVKQSGKTVNIKFILDNCANKNTHVIIFCGTVNNDPMWKIIKDSLKKRKIKYSAFTSIFTDSGTNIVETLIKTLQEGADIDDNEYDPEDEKLQRQSEYLVKSNIINFGDPIPETIVEVNEKPKKKKMIAVDYIIIFDDLSSELKNSVIPKIMRIHRHFSTKIIISSQSYLDTDPKIRKGNLDYVLIYGGIPESVMEKIYEEQSIETVMPFEAFFKMYKHATAEKYNFLFIDRNKKFRKNYNKEYEVEDI